MNRKNARVSKRLKAGGHIEQGRTGTIFKLLPDKGLIERETVAFFVNADRQKVDEPVIK